MVCFFIVHVSQSFLTNVNVCQEMSVIRELGNCMTMIIKQCNFHCKEIVREKEPAKRETKNGLRYVECKRSLVFYHCAICCTVYCCCCCCC